MFCDIIKELRKDAGLTQEELAEKLNISRSALSKYETGRNDPSLEFLIKFSTFFNVSADYLLGKTRLSSPATIINNLNYHSPDVQKKLNLILQKFRDEKYIDFIYSILSSIQKLK